MSTKAELVRQISAVAFTDAIDLMACLGVLRESETLGVADALQAADASRAATIVQKALLQRVLMTVERAFAPVKHKSDRHARVAFEYLSDPSIFEEVAKAGSRKQLEQARATWRIYDQDARRRRLRHYRDKVVAHAGERDPAIPVPLVSELRNYAMGTADALARLARGSGVVELGLQMPTYDESAKAFWRVWRNQSKWR
jgi:AbiU2